MAEKKKLLELCNEVCKADDRIGRYSDHEGQEEGPTYRLWQNGYETFKSHCERAIEDHQNAIRVFRKLKKFNEKRKNL